MLWSCLSCWPPRSINARIASSFAMLAQIPVSPVAFVFPGQGSQSVGMLQEVKDLPAVKLMLTKAKEVLGYDLLQICIEVNFWLLMIRCVLS